MPVIFITGYSDVRIAVQLMKHGASDYITKPLFPEPVLDAVRNALQEAYPAEANTQIAPDKGLVEAASAQMKEVYRLIDLVAPSPYTVIIQGESGTGKESVAHAIHNRSTRARKPFVALDCGALSRDLAMSELFGHEKGAFTGASTTKPGQFELAKGGTLFLDEVGNLPYDVQVSILRVLQERKMRSVGGLHDEPVDVRLIVATNENLAQAVQNGTFREDLYYRLNEFSIKIAPLRERQGDILPLAEHFRQLANHELHKALKGFTAEAEAVLLNYYWPGNVRELKNAVRRAALVCTGEFIGKSDLPQELYGNGSETGATQTNNTNRQIAADLKHSAQLAEQKLIMEVLQQVNFNRSLAAQILNIDRKTLYNKMKRFKKD